MNDPIKAISLWQPWASLIALRLKWIETRSWSTSYRGRLIIHAAATLAGLQAIECDYEDGWKIGVLDGDDRREYHWQRIDGEPVVMMYAEGDEEGHREGPTPLPLGAVIATCNLVDVVPMVAPDAPSDAFSRPALIVSPAEFGLRIARPSTHSAHGFTLQHCEDQRPYGDFAPGRFAWLLDDIKPTTERCPACWRTVDCVTCDNRGSVPVPGGGMACPDCFVATPAECKVCGDYGWTDPIPARGRQQLWNWAA